jgi:hypothetical protein
MLTRGKGNAEDIVFRPQGVRNTLEHDRVARLEIYRLYRNLTLPKLWELDGD